jgi:hypothetical protein
MAGMLVQKLPSKGLNILCPSPLLPEKGEEGMDRFSCGRV